MSNTRRTPQQIAFIGEYLESHYETDGPDKCAVHLKEPIKYILNRARLLALKQPKPIKPVKESEVEKLRRLNDELKTELIRSSQKVVNLGKSINLYKSRESNLIKKIEEMEKEPTRIW